MDDSDSYTTPFLKINQSFLKLVKTENIGTVVI